VPAVVGTAEGAAVTDSEQRLAPPGWYVDPSGSGHRRWWNGLAWTHYMEGDAPPQGMVSGPVAQPLIPSNVTLNPWPIWLLVLLPAIATAQLLTIDFEGFFRETLLASQSGAPARLLLPPGYLFAQVLGWVLYLGGVALAFLDWWMLKQRGVVRPFFWAWSFLPPLVYLIGRTVVLRRRATRGQGPLWTYLLVSLVSGAIGGYFVANALLNVLTDYAAAYSQT
jgi:hypothetical protein